MHKKHCQTVRCCPALAFNGMCKIAHGMLSNTKTLERDEQPH